MKILPPATQPWPEAIVRRHRPPQEVPYPKLRQCLRWEFGFTCAFCLLHEADLAFFGIEGTGLTGIEHFVPQSVDSRLRRDYENLLYICRFCNLARGRKPVLRARARLLNPCKTSWAVHFRLTDDRLAPQTEHARFTEEIYELNSWRKVKLREKRRQIIEDRLKFLKEESPKLRQALMDRALAAQDPGSLEVARLLAELEAKAWADLVRFAIVPFDARDCICPAEIQKLTLPACLDAAAIDLRTI